MAILHEWPEWEDKLILFEEFGYQPSPLQAEVHHLLPTARTQPQVVLILGGERAGKSTVAGMEAAAAACAWCDLVYVAGESFENTEPEFDIMAKAFRELGALASRPAKPKRGQWEMQLKTGCMIQTISFNRDGPDALIATGQAPDLILLAEAGLLSYAEFLAAFGRVAERRGLVLASGTLKAAQPWYPEKFREFKGANVFSGRSISLPSWANVSIYPGGRQDPVIQALANAYDEQTFLERFGAEPVPSGLLVFGREFSHDLHVRRCEYDPELPIEVAVDPGYAGAYAVEVMQWTGPADVRVIDEFYRQYATWDQAIDWVRVQPWGSRITSGVADVAIAQHHADRSQYEQWRSRGIHLRSQAVSIEDGISRMRDFLRSPSSGTPRITYDPRCKSAIWEFGRESYPSDQDGQPLKEHPVDRFNHARKAVSYWLIAHFGRSDVAGPRRKASSRTGKEEYWS